MKKLNVLVLLMAIAGILHAQDLAHVPAQTLEISILFSWRWVSYNSYSTLDVCSDNLVLFEGKSLEYVLHDGAFYFPPGGGPLRYTYDVRTDRLRLTFPDGTAEEYWRAVESVYERRYTQRMPENRPLLYGRFCTSDPYNGTQTKGIRISPSGEFDFSPRPSYVLQEAENQSSLALGTVLVCGNAVIFSFSSGFAAEGQVLERDGTGVIRLEYYREIFGKYQCPDLRSPEPWPVPDPGPPSPEPSPQPGIPKRPSPTAEQPPAPEPPKRNIGTTRGDANTPPSSTTDTGSRGTGTRR